MFSFRSGSRRRGCSCLGGGGVADVQIWVKELRIFRSGGRRGCLGEGGEHGGVGLGGGGVEDVGGGGGKSSL